MAVALIGSGVSAFSSDSGVSVTTGAYDTTGANFIAVVISHDSGASSYTVTDNKSNTATKAIDSTGVLSPQSAIWYFQNPTVGSGHTFTVAQGADGKPFPAVVVLAFSGMVTVSVLDGTQVNTGGNVTGTSSSTGSVTPSANGYLLISGMSSNSAVLNTINSSFNTPITTAFVGFNAYQNSGSYFVQPTAGAINPTWSWTNSADANTTIAVFKAAGGASAFNPSWATGATKVIGGTF